MDGGRALYKTNYDLLHPSLSYCQTMTGWLTGTKFILQHDMVRENLFCFMVTTGLSPSVRFLLSVILYSNLAMPSTQLIMSNTTLGRGLYIPKMGYHEN